MEITQHVPSEILEQIKRADSSVRKLVLSGYDLNEKSAQNPIEAAKVEYNYADDRAVVFLAREGEETLGSLTIILWKDNPSDKRGSRFWPKLRELDPELAQKAVEFNPLACDIGGIVTHPNRRGQGLGQMLYDKALEVLKPSILVGQTKTVGAVMLRSKLKDYRTFYGNTEVTFTNPQPYTQEHKSLVQAYLFARDIQQLLPEGLVYEYEGGIAPTPPDVTGYPSIIQQAFKPVIEAQKHTTKTVMAPCISIRKDLLPIVS